MGGLATVLRPRLHSNALVIAEPRGTALDGAVMLAGELARTRVAPRTAV
jgi:hypothetical protein